VLQKGLNAALVRRVAAAVNKSGGYGVGQGAVVYLIKPLCLLTVTCTDTGRDISAKVVMAIMEL
jgi:hypothetical protein